MLKTYLCKCDELFGKIDIVLLGKLVECRCQVFAVSTPDNTFTSTDGLWIKLYGLSHIQTLLCSLFVVVLAMVVLAVTYFCHFKNCYVT